MNITQLKHTEFNLEHLKGRASKWRSDFPILSRTVYNKPLVYLDNAASTQKPNEVIDAISTYYRKYHSNVHRGAHYLSGMATEAYEAARYNVAAFINAASSNEINFTKGTTEAINLVAFSFGEKFIKAGDEIIISEMEHHSNIVPWQMLCERKKAVLKVIPINENGDLDLFEYRSLLNDKTRIVSIAYVSNSLGTVNPVREVIKAAHEVGAKVMLDAAQAVAHMSIDVQELDCDFLAFSGHKIYGPTGIGVLYGKENLLEEMPPYQGGGEMIREVSFRGSTYNDLPYKFEAGTPNIAGGIGLGAAINYLLNAGMDDVRAYEEWLMTYSTRVLSNIERLNFVGNALQKTGLHSFNIDGIHAYDLGVLLDKMGIAIRTGHHCCMPVMEKFKIEGTARASFCLYNTSEDIDKLAEGLERAKMMLS